VTRTSNFNQTGCCTANGEGTVLLIHPPVAKPSEPPPGIASLHGSLNRHLVRCDLLDANLEGLLYLLKQPGKPSDRWTERAFRNISRNLSAVRKPLTYRNLDRYKRAVVDLNRALEMSSQSTGARLSLANYQHLKLSPLESSNLLRAAENPAENQFYPYFSERLTAILRERKVRIIGFSLNFLSQALCTFAMLGFLRRNFPNVTLAAGGGLITSWMRRPGWANPFAGLIDHQVAGPGETFLLSLLGLNADGDAHFKPKYDSLPVADYFAPGLILPYSASNGCYWNKCSFCPERAEKNPYIPLPADRVVADLRHMASSMKPVLIHLLDNAVSPALMKALCENPPGIPWYGFARITRHFEDQEFCMALKRSGCVMMKLGLESGDQEVLDQERKGVSVETASKALHALKRAGIATYVYLLFGTPAETLKAARKTLDFTVKHGDQIDFLNLAVFNLPIHGPDAAGLQTGLMYEGDLSLYTGFIHPKGWHRVLVRQFLDREFKRHPVIASILREDPPLFTSNHAPFFCMQD